MTGSGRTTSALPEYVRDRLATVLLHYPELAEVSVALMSGQFNHALIVGDIVFRFPRTRDAAASMATEVAVLNQLHDQLPIPVPHPRLTTAPDESGLPIFMAYQRLPGTPLDRSTLDNLRVVERVGFERIGEQLGGFLRVLHGFSSEQFAETLSLADDVTHWTRMLGAFQDELFPFMRPDASREVDRSFLEFLHSSDSIDWQPVLRHGDFGGANLLYDADARQLSGVIDFGSVALGDPAVDLAAITAFDERLAQAMQPHYPDLLAPETQRRAAFYRSTFALQQALWAVRAGDADGLREGIAGYV